MLGVQRTHLEKIFLTQPELDFSIGEVAWVEGNIHVERKQQFFQIKENDPLLHGDRLITGDQSRVFMKVKDKAEISLLEKSKVILRGNRIKLDEGIIEIKILSHEDFDLLIGNFNISLHKTGVFSFSDKNKGTARSNSSLVQVVQSFEKHYFDEVTPIKKITRERLDSLNTWFKNNGNKSHQGGEIKVTYQPDNQAFKAFVYAGEFLTKNQRDVRSKTIKEGEKLSLENNFGKAEVKQLLAPPNLLSPLTSELILMSSEELVFKFSSVKGAVAYQFELSKDASFNKKVYSEELTGVILNLKQPPVTGEWYWRVAGIDSEGDRGRFSKLFSFSLNEEANTPDLKYIKWRQN